MPRVRRHKRRINPSESVFRMLYFQYKPLEIKLKKYNPELYKKYLKMSPSQKIALLDKIAYRLGL